MSNLIVVLLLKWLECAISTSQAHDSESSALQGNLAKLGIDLLELEAASRMVPFHEGRTSARSRIPDEASSRLKLSTPSPSESLVDKLQKILDKHSSFWNVSISFAVHNDTLEAAAASGRDDYADPSSKLTVNKSIPMGSTTKMYSAVGVLRLAENGTISLDQKVAPLVDKYLAVKLPCEQAPSYCASTCFPYAYCYKKPDTKCASLSPVFKANCSYCTRYLHCHCDDTACPSVVSLRMFWNNISTIEEVTFRQLLGMQSGVSDYYYDKTNWLMKEVLSTTRDIEPLEYLAHMDKNFIFPPNSGRASYSTNGFSLVGLALAGHFNLTHWADLDQRALAWGDDLFPDDQTLFPVRGPCTKDPRIAHQWSSPGLNKTFFDISSHSCLNSWMGGDLAARPLDVARFTYRVFTGKLLNESSLKEMTSLHEITDGFAKGYLAYGLGLEASWNNGKPTPMPSCGGMLVYGHGGADYGSGAPLGGYIPQLKLGVSFAMTSMPLIGASPMGMNCSLRYESLGRATEMAMNDVINVVRQEAGLEPACPASTYDIPPLSECQDAPSFGKIDFIPMTCGRFVEFAAKMSKQATASVMCSYVFERYTLAEYVEQSRQRHSIYTPPAGYNVNTTRLVDLCKGTCAAVGAGPCWLRGAAHTWCDATKVDATYDASQELPEILV